MFHEQAFFLRFYAFSWSLLAFSFPMALTSQKIRFAALFTNLLPSDCCSYSVSNWRHNFQEPSASYEQRELMMQMKCIKCKMRIGSFCCACRSILSLEFLVCFFQRSVSAVASLISRENVARLLSSRCLCSFQFHYFYFSYCLCSGSQWNISPLFAG